MIRKICSWDVGIKHLSYCIISNKDNKIEIEKWENIDLTDSDKLVCGSRMKKKNQNILCNAKAKFYCEIDNEVKYYCGTHKSEHKIDFDQIEKELVECLENKTKCSHVGKNNKQCNKNALYKMNNSLYCKIHKEQRLKEHIKKLSLKPIKNIKCTSTDPQILCGKLYEKLNNIPELQFVDEIYIENQPTFINPTMKAVSSMLFSYFIYLFGSNNLKEKVIKFVSPSVKITLTDELIKFIEEKINVHKLIKKENCKCRLCKLLLELNNNKETFQNKYASYKFTYDPVKELGILYTEKILNDNNCSEYFNQIKDSDKKDDKCDAFLHGYKKIINK